MDVQQIVVLDSGRGWTCGFDGSDRDCQSDGHESLREELHLGDVVEREKVKRE